MVENEAREVAPGWWEVVRLWRCLKVLLTGFAAGFKGFEVFSPNNWKNGVIY